MVETRPPLQQDLEVVEEPAGVKAVRVEAAGEAAAEEITRAARGGVRAEEGSG